MKLKFIISILYILLFNRHPLSAQKQFINEANKLFDENAYSEAAKMYNVLLQENYVYEYNLKLAQCYKEMNVPEFAEYWYAQLLKQSVNDPQIILEYAQLLKLNGKYTSAKQVFLQYAQYNEDGFYLAGTCDYAMNNTLDKGMIKIDTISFNTAGSEISSSYFGKGILFASNGFLEESDKKAEAASTFYDLFYAEKKTDMFLSPAKMNGNINSKVHEAAACYDNFRNELYFTRNSFFKGRSIANKNGAVNLKLYIAKYNNGKYKPVYEFPLNSKNYSIGQPCLSADGNVLIFVSDMPGGYGGTDIYFTQRSNNIWSKPQNFGPVINTKGDEMFPFINDDGKLYFASDWHPGYGGLDIFISERENKNWSKPKNIGLPVNSARDDFALIMKNGNGYFASNREGGKGSDDIYAFTILNTIQGLYVTDEKGIPVKDAKIKLIKENQFINAGQTDVAGFLAIKLEENKKYTIQIQFKGYIETTITDAHNIRTSTGILPIIMQTIINTQEKELEIKNDIPLPDKGVSDKNAVYTYELQIGVFKNPDYGKISSLTAFGELSVKSREEGTILSFSLINMESKVEAEKAKAEAIKQGFNDAYVIIYKNGIRQN
ncbi:MAG: PD40 domain-containing protein [Fimbriimonadaceae bacterium]|nr:PD40 domain-containing protein [Chitinophagales bacterium]